MNPNATSPWQSLFPAPTASEQTQALEFRLLSKYGEPFLLLPINRRAAVEGLSLYPAQTPKARLARALMGMFLRVGRSPGTRPVTLNVDESSPFVRFLGDVAGNRDFDFALLMGNPRAPGRRFICLVFDQAGRPRAVVKAGANPVARDLIRRELNFLRTTSPDISTAPAIQRVLVESDLEAIALEYVPGTNPSAGRMDIADRLLESWLDLKAQVRFSELPAAQRLTAGMPDNPPLRRILTELADAKCHPALFHGDFAPWNIRVDACSGRWRVLDWERGESMGPPAWDWFHFVLQPAVLVQRAAGKQLWSAAEELLHSTAFLEYARKAGVAGHARQLLLAYLLYCQHVIQQTEGMNRIEQLMQSLAAR